MNKRRFNFKIENKEYPLKLLLRAFRNVHPVSFNRAYRNVQKLRTVTFSKQKSMELISECVKASIVIVFFF